MNFGINFKMDYQQLQDFGQRGKLVMAKIPEHARPQWALNFLRLIDGKIPVPPKPVADLYGIENKHRWGEAYDQFQRIRKFSISNPGFDPEEYLILAERISKITYNQTTPKAPFDYDAGWPIPYLALEIAAKLNDKELERQIQELIATAF